MACNCIEAINGKLAERNSKLSFGLVVRGNKMDVSIVIGTEVIEKKRGARPTGVVPTFCPFCGVKYDDA